MHTHSSHRVLLTGANGFIGSHILSQLLSTGLSVRAVVRSQSKIDGLLQTRLLPDTSNEHNPHFDFAIVPDITIPDAFNPALQSPLAGHAIDAIIHTASPFLYRNVRNNLEDLLEPAVKGMQQILNAASQAPSVKRIIITSSIAAISSHGLGHDDKITPGKTYTAEDWNRATWEAVSTPDFSIAYRASKKFAEREAWDFMTSQHPPFDLVVLCPPMVYGPLLSSSITCLADLNESNLRIYRLFIASSSSSLMPPNGVHLYADVRDVAHAHVRAVLTLEAGNERFVISRGSITSPEIADMLRGAFPTELAGRTPIGRTGEDTLGEGAYGADSGKAMEVLGVDMGARGKGGTFVELGGQFLAMERDEVRSGGLGVL